MKTKYFAKSVFLMIILLASAFPSIGSITANIPTETPAQKVQRLEHRLEEIKGLNTSKMTRSERKALRTEVRAIKKEMAALSGGVYISIGALILIALLLILLL